MGRNNMDSQPETPTDFIGRQGAIMKNNLKGVAIAILVATLMVLGFVTAAEASAVWGG
jgi:hypothetical protein